jgi:divalent metal cation (Fe/Co/Zn/Cd) transporter
MTAEGAIAIVAGLVAGSIALIGFGLDSAIEGLASIIIIWRFSGARLHSARSERRAQQLVALSFFLLAPYVAVEAIRTLVGGQHPETSWLGIGLAIASLVAMPVLGVAKQQIGVRLGSVAASGEGAQNLICAYMAGALVLGLLGNALFGAWWLDPVAALAIAALAVREGVQAWRGDSCCVADDAPSSLAPASELCGDECCR